ncbi:unnamed protein product [Auanema sp. JU1783]|nr:unnamed protein product [Auanema sp. JU1783]
MNFNSAIINRNEAASCEVGNTSMDFYYPSSHQAAESSIIASLNAVQDDDMGDELTELEILRLQAANARQKRNMDRMMEREQTQMTKKLDGVGSFVNQLRGIPDSTEPKSRIMLDTHGYVVRNRRPLLHNIGGAVVLTNHSNQTVIDDLPPLPHRPSNPAELRKLVRSKMIRCKVCHNRFGETHILERHLRDKHPVEYLEFLYEQELFVEKQREEEAEQNRIEELTSGGFIPPQSEIDAPCYDVRTENIPLPGELTGGVPAKVDSFGRLKLPRRVYKKKVSPQCVFCDKRFRNDVSLKKHIIKKHPECTEFVQCLDCFKCLPQKEDLTDHACDMTYLCIECTPIRNLCSEERLVNHRMKFHRGASSGFKCHECNIKFLTPRKLRKHKKMAHVFVKTYPCHFCEEHFTSEVSVTTHERMHTGIIKFECKICDYKSNRYSEMEEHMKEEHGYLCSICQEKFADWADIKNHTLIQHGGYLSSESNAGYIESPRVWVMMKGE